MVVVCCRLCGWVDTVCGCCVLVVGFYGFDVGVDGSVTRGCVVCFWRSFVLVGLVVFGALVLCVDLHFAVRRVAFKYYDVVGTLCCVLKLLVDLVWFGRLLPCGVGLDCGFWWWIACFACGGVGVLVVCGFRLRLLGIGCSVVVWLGFVGFCVAVCVDFVV